MSVRKLLLAGALAAALSGCVGTNAYVAPALASARVAPDFSSYEIRRVGVLPHDGVALEPNEADVFATSLFGEFSRSTPYEFVRVDLPDHEGVVESRPYEEGRYHPQTILELSRRFELDALLFPTIVHRKWFPPQQVSISVDLVAAETGLVIWSSVVHLDAEDPAVIDGLKIFYGFKPKVLDEWPDESWDTSLVSPAKFTRFAVHELAELL